MTCEEPDVCGICQKFICACSRTPRVAESLDDLRVGQVLATRAVASGLWSIDNYTLEWQHEGGPWNFDGGRVVILSDPPPEPVRVPADLIDALAERMDAIYPSDYNGDPGSVVEAARAVVDTARNGTDQ